MGRRGVQCCGNTGVQCWEIWGMGLWNVGCRTGECGVVQPPQGNETWSSKGRCGLGRACSVASLTPQSSQFNQQGPSKVPSYGGPSRALWPLQPRPTGGSSAGGQDAQGPLLPRWGTCMVARPQGAGDSDGLGPWDPCPCPQPSPRHESCSCVRRVSGTRGLLQLSSH